MEHYFINTASLSLINVQTNEANVMLRARNEALQSDIEKKHCEVSTLQSSLREETDAVSSLTKKLTLVSCLQM